MTSGEDQSGRASDPSERLSEGTRDRPRPPLGPRSPQRPGSSRTQYSLTTAHAPLAPEADAGAASNPGPPTSPERRQGSSRTQYRLTSELPSTVKIATTDANHSKDEIQIDMTASPEMDKRLLSPTTTARTNVEVMSAVQSEKSESGGDVLPPYDFAERYRSPEAVVEHVEDADNPSSLPPGIVDATWEQYEAQSTFVAPAEHPERPQIGPGRMTAKWFADLHPHKLVQPAHFDLPRPAKSPSSSPTTTLSTLTSNLSTATSGDAPVPSTPTITVDDVWEVLPGGKEGRGEWFFCPECWAWFKIVIGNGEFPLYRLHGYRDPRPRVGESEEDELRAWWNDKVHLGDMKASRDTAPGRENHFHTFERLYDPIEEESIPRVVVEGMEESFAHHDPNYGTPTDELVNPNHGKTNRTDLHVSCSNDCWISVSGPVGGQVPKALAARWTDEKRANPAGGRDGVTSAVEAWLLVLTLLQNPLFKEKRGFVKMSNPRFYTHIGAGLLSHILLERLGFTCVNGPEGNEIGPFRVLDGQPVTKAHVDSMYAYMLRSWVEVSLYLQGFLQAHGKPTTSIHVQSKALSEILNPLLQLDKISTMSVPWGPTMQAALNTLGVATTDTCDTIDTAYDFQVTEDHANVAKYLSALDHLSKTQVPGVDTLVLKVAIERSKDRFSEEDLDKAYSLIGMGNDVLEAIMVARTDCPAEFVYKQHKEAMDKASSPQERQEISNALLLVGRDRGDTVMQNLGKEGRTHLTLDQAYSEFNLTRESNIDNEMLILQYETWIADRPSRADHYRLALSIIANAPGEERPQLQAFLAGKDISEFQGPARRDIPAGLKNIGNTCYLNSVLQFLYAVKPIRDAVMAFEQTPAQTPPPDEDPKATEKRVKFQSSCLFVKMLGDLFSQMYETDQSAVVPAEELARLAILPIDMVEQRHDTVIPKGQITIDSLPTAITSPTSSGAATVADTAPATPTSPIVSPHGSPHGSPRPLISPHRRPSVLGKRGSEDRESTFGGSEERLRRPTGTRDDLIEMGSPLGGSRTSTMDVPRDGDVEMATDPPTREGSDLEPADAGLSSLELVSSPLVSSDHPPLGPVTPRAGELGLTTPPQSPPRSPRVSMSEALNDLPRQPPPLPPRRRSHALVAAEKFGLQQDAAEILTNVLAQLECAFDRPDHEGGNLIKRLFAAKFRQQMLLESGTGDGVLESYPPVDSVFVHPIIGVEEDDKDLYDCLAELYLGGAEIEYGGKKGYKMDLLDELPPTLYILMRRSQYDFVKGRQTKTNTHIPFGKTLVMDRFMAGADPERREASIACTRRMMRMRARRHELKNHKPLSVPDTFRFVHDALSDDRIQSALISNDMEALGSDVTPELLDALGSEAVRSESEIADLERDLIASKAELEAMWAGSREVEYELVSVFVHGGTGTGGHYWTYQADLAPDQPQPTVGEAGAPPPGMIGPVAPQPGTTGHKFFYYSDENVKDVPETEVFADKSAQGVSPALLVYVRKGQGLVETLHRKPAPEQTGADAEENGWASGASNGWGGSGWGSGAVSRDDGWWAGPPQPDEDHQEEGKRSNSVKFAESTPTSRQQQPVLYGTGGLGF